MANKWLQVAASRAADSEGMLGSTLRRYCELEGKEPETLAEAFGCPEETIQWLFLCRVPRESSFEDDIDAIARRFGVNETALATAIRTVQVVEGVGFNGSTAGVLLAARDRFPKKRPKK